ncbi:hypothetical protein F2Q70_00031820 [Brassica cretica]|uniref:Uncharacterized protein n=1 Tax=Brassica cretica TaxID=69181 RepID=A0A8S9FMC4_BRACR|nr:hypothetical protein F2Q70_00031820 [Brassica cretica]
MVVVVEVVVLVGHGAQWVGEGFLELRRTPRYRIVEIRKVQGCTSGLVPGLQYHLSEKEVLSKIVKELEGFCSSQ